MRRKVKAVVKKLKPHADITDLVVKKNKEQDEIDEQDIKLAIEEWQEKHRVGEENE